MASTSHACSVKEEGAENNSPVPLTETTVDKTPKPSAKPVPSNEECGIREVWESNLEEEFRVIRQVVQKYHYISMDTEFPGVVAHPFGGLIPDFQYQGICCNVNQLTIIQLGLTFFDEYGNLPTDTYSTWQFNFCFDLAKDTYAQDSIDLLVSSGIQFDQLAKKGIVPAHFAELMMTSGIVLMDDIKWLTFHSCYDFGYLIKVLTCLPLPDEEYDFFISMMAYFPVVYDLKYLMKSCKNLKGGLQEVADILDIPRIGPQHQAGSDALLTGMIFFKMREMYFENFMDDEKYSGHIYGLTASYTSTHAEQLSIEGA